MQEIPVVFLIIFENGWELEGGFWQNFWSKNILINL